MAKQVNADKFRSDQAYSAYLWYNKGYKWAIRHNSSLACPICRRANGEKIAIILVVNGQADHKNGHCWWSFTT